jgi:primase-polymerase (primpol)-like protein
MSPDERPAPAHIPDDAVETVPAELRDREIWLPWQWRWKQPKGRSKGKWDKPPVGPAGHDIDATDPANWHPFDDARHYARERGDGVGIALGKPDNRVGIVGVDFDDCISNGALTENVATLVKSLDSYTCITPSRSGLRSLVWGSKPGDKCKNTARNIEVYHSDRYLCVTPWHLPGTRMTIERRQAEIDAL